MVAQLVERKGLSQTSENHWFESLPHQCQSWPMLAEHNAVIEWRVLSYRYQVMLRIAHACCCLAGVRLLRYCTASLAKLGSSVRVNNWGGAALGWC